MKPYWQISRQGLAWMLVSFFAVTAQHVEHLPVWVVGSSAVVIFWRVQIFRGVWRYPRFLAKAAILTVCLAGLFIAYGRLNGLEPMTALLVIAYCLKILEMHNRRDALVVVFLAYFVAILQCLFYQTMASALYISFCLLLVTTSLVGVYQTATTSFWIPLKLSIKVLLQALPIMILLFLVMPRVGSLWSVPIQKHAAKTGVSDFMSPGDIAKLGRSGEVAFRVTFDGEPPARGALYWRGLVFSDFDGRTWSQGSPFGYGDSVSLLQWVGEPSESWSRQINYTGPSYKYRVIMEPTHQPWLYALETPQPRTLGTALTRDLRLISSTPVSGKTSYEVESWPRFSGGEALSASRRQVETDLPTTGNPRSREIAKEWRRQEATDRQYIQRILQLYNREFFYTLSPPLLGQHTVDEFLWQSKQGFCAHFAGSFVFMMRAAGIPARVVVGYQGGEYQPEAGYMIVRQYDAHAWAEVWMTGLGWVRVDPTAAVSPERIDLGLAGVFADEEAFASEQVLSLEKFRRIPLINQLRLRLDQLDYAWAVWVLGYDRKQDSFLSGILGDTSPVKIAVLLGSVGGAIMFVLAVVTLRTRKPERYSPEKALWLSLSRKLKRAGIPLQNGEGISDYITRIKKQVGIQDEKLERLIMAIEQLLYNPASEEDLKLLQKQVRAYRPARSHRSETSVN